ncbi:hypothetical protein GUITHDRAFT_110915 [Guillardia theta CCMP2712]|uniref:Uncharacterized protein n=2 Tax=Guillardia theta TaxID=55529 RepID=L1J3T3_GUITC|nr:hypothetical protein GUITHDRAFT_110915 [Guillardia theta CCMP2712]EKX43188.1 hypothetical protein GUITHDRAFT_110915 [Guillardia theta CCMP2712]|eukprot:XP_005830168.1 hypothetical protein GUITHDRAFT_110915 [Guillardia theta CCMP2712]
MPSGTMPVLSLHETHLSEIFSTPSPKGPILTRHSDLSLPLRQLLFSPRQTASLGENDTSMLSDAEESMADELLCSLLREEEELSQLQDHLREACTHYLQTQDEHEHEDEDEDEDEEGGNGEEEQGEGEDGLVEDLFASGPSGEVALAKSFHVWRSHTTSMLDTRLSVEERRCGSRRDLLSSCVGAWKVERQESRRLERLSNFLWKQGDRDLTNFFFFSWKLNREASKISAAEDVCKSSMKQRPRQVEIALCEEFLFTHMMDSEFDSNRDVNVVLEDDLNNDKEGSSDEEVGDNGWRMSENAQSADATIAENPIGGSKDVACNTEGDANLECNDNSLFQCEVNKEIEESYESFPGLFDKTETVDDVNVHEEEYGRNDTSVMSEAGWSQVDLEDVMMQQKEELLSMIRRMQNELKKKEKIIEEQHLELNMFRRQSLNRLRCYNHIGEEDSSLVRAKLSL